jgi:Tfp pilus assembly protein PilN
MKTIDFLPDIYRQREALRRARIWWAVVVMIFGGAIGASSLAQAWLRHGLLQQLDSLSADYAAAQSQVQELSNLQTQIVRAGHEASLYTFLENPWPRTQLLAEVVGPLPSEIRLTKISIVEEELSKSAIQVGPRNTKAEEEAAAKASAPEKDLSRLQEDISRRQTAIDIEGYTSDVPKLHEYVAELSRSSLILSATPKSLEASNTAEKSRTRFTLRLIVRPGYSQRAEAMATTPGSERMPLGGGQ